MKNITLLSATLILLASQSYAQNPNQPRMEQRNAGNNSVRPGEQMANQGSRPVQTQAASQQQTNGKSVPMQSGSENRPMRNYPSASQSQAQQGQGEAGKPMERREERRDERRGNSQDRVDGRENRRQEIEQPRNSGFQTPNANSNVMNQATPSNSPSAQPIKPAPRGAESNSLYAKPSSQPNTQNIPQNKPNQPSQPTTNNKPSTNNGQSGAEIPANGSIRR